MACLLLVVLALFVLLFLSFLIGEFRSMSERLPPPPLADWPEVAEEPEGFAPPPPRRSTQVSDTPLAPQPLPHVLAGIPLRAPARPPLIARHEPAPVGNRWVRAWVVAGLVAVAVLLFLNIVGFAILFARRPTLTP